MSKNSQFRGPFDKHGKRSQSLLKFAPQHLYHIHWSMPSQLNWEIFFYWQAKSWDCLLRHWLPMKSILFLIETIWRYQFRCNYHSNKKLFPNIFSAFWKSTLNFKHFAKKDDGDRFCIFEITDSENVVR